MGQPLSGYVGADWSRRRIATVMGDAADRCGGLAALLAMANLGPDPNLLRRQAQSVNAMRWAEGVFLAWARGDAASIAQLGADDLIAARNILATAERAAQ